MDTAGSEKAADDAIVSGGLDTEVRTQLLRLKLRLTNSK